MAYLPLQCQCPPVLPGNWGRNKRSKKGTSALGRVSICTGLPRMIPVYTCYSSVIINSALKSVPVWTINCMVTSTLCCKDVIPSIPFRALKATEFHILMNLYLTGIKKRSLKPAKGCLPNDRMNQGYTQ